MKRRLSPANFEPDTDLYVALAITESIRAWMKELKSTKYHGRFPNDARAAYRAVHRLRRPTARSPYVQGCLSPSERFGIRPVCLRCRPRRSSSRGTASHTSFQHFAELQGKMRKKECALYRRCWL